LLLLLLLLLNATGETDIMSVASDIEEEVSMWRNLQTPKQLVWHAVRCVSAMNNQGNQGLQQAHITKTMQQMLYSHIWGSQEPSRALAAAHVAA
jgi:hypothetical protein